MLAREHHLAHHSLCAKPTVGSQTHTEDTNPPNWLTVTADPGRPSNLGHSAADIAFYATEIAGALKTEELGSILVSLPLKLITLSKFYNSKVSSTASSRKQLKIPPTVPV